MIELRGQQLRVSFPEVHPKATCRIDFQRTLRVPDDNQDYPLPAGLGTFPVMPVDDFDVPTAWKTHGGVFLPIYQSEAMWIRFGTGALDYPFAVKVAAGKVNAITGKAWSNKLSSDPQDYLVLPEQRWLDGFSVSRDIVKQFVAMPLGQGLTAEEQITGSDDWGGLQLIFYPMKAEEYRKRFEVLISEECLPTDTGIRFSRVQEEEMGLAPGGRIQQEIAEDPFGIDVWDTRVSSRCFVHLLNSECYQQITGRLPPTKPMTPKQYAAAGMPWFDHYLEGKALPGSGILSRLDGVASALLKKGQKLSDNQPIPIAKTVTLSEKSSVVRDGTF